MRQQMIKYINDVFMDLEAACQECGESLCAEGLADAVGDHMYDTSAEYRAMPYDQRRAITLQLCQQYV
jgi:hypothetical protein